MTMPDDMPDPERPVTAGEIIALARAVGDLSRDVGNLRSTLVRAIEESAAAQRKAQDAENVANRLTSERIRTLFWIRFTIGAFTFAFVLAGVIGYLAWTGYQTQQRDLATQTQLQRQGSYQTCVERNQQSAAGAAFLRDYITAVAKHDPATAREVAAVISRYQSRSAPAPDCTRILKTK